MAPSGRVSINHASSSPALRHIPSKSSLFKHGDRACGGVSKALAIFTAHPRKNPKVAAPDRVLSDVLLSIKPVHLANIVSRQKNHEYRKYRLQDGVSRLWLYETGDNGGRRAIS